MIIIYFLVAFCATTFGALAGLGGGVIIKPVLDALGHFDISTIGVLSSVTVFSMAIVSTLKQVAHGFKVKRNLLFLSIGSIVGGAIGKELFSLFLTMLNSEEIASGIQAIILASLLIMVLFKRYLPTWHIKNSIAVFLIGAILGTIASFLGIGGGPINVAVLCMFMALDIRDAAVDSIFIILLSQLSKISLLIFSGELFTYDLSMLLLMIPGGILGGFIGAKLNRKVEVATIHKIFNIALVLIITLNLYNAYVAFNI